MTMMRRWSLLAVVVIAAIVVAGWFLLVAPKRSEAAALEVKTAAQLDANERLEQQIELLKSQQADLPRERARLAELGRQMPSNPALPALIRSLTQAGRQAGVSVDAMSPSAPVAVVAVAAPGVAPAPAAPGVAPAPAAPAASGAATTTAALYQVPLELSLTGSYFELEQFVNKLEGLKRSFLVTGYTLGEPKTDTGAAGDLGLTLQGRVFLTPPAAVAATTTIPVATATAGN